MDYQQAWKFLDNLQFFKVKLGLDAMDLFMSRLGNPHRELKFIHIGGTNGKGSVGATLCSILSEAGFKVGFYTSPHLTSVRERFRIGSSYIPKNDFALLSGEIATILGKEQITYFEFTTALALLWFKQQKVDIVLMEVGMGGRLDATNIISPMVSIITNVSMDHEEYLGNTIAKIAGEKAGIIKTNTPVVSGVETATAIDVMEAASKQKTVPFYLSGRDFTGKKTTAGHWDYTGIKTNNRNLPLRMKGRYQVGNCALALAAIELIKGHGFKVTDKALRAGLDKVTWPGRLEILQTGNDNPLGGSLAINEKRLFLLDGAHNPAGVEALRQAIENEFSYDRLILIWGAMADKDIKTALAIIAPLAGQIFFTRAESERSANPELLKKLLAENKHKTPEAKIKTKKTVKEAIESAVNSASENDLICIAGSLHLVGRARQLLLGEIVDG
jgi:dihydrofolate synthase/folylpolyglutamate synthase